VRLRHVTLFVHDQDLVARWYVQHLGFQEIDRRVLAREDGVRFDSVQIGIGGLWINVSRLPNLARRDPALTYAGWRHIALAVRDVPGTWARLRAAGVDVLGPAPYRFAVEGSRFGAQSYVAGFLRDPEGNVVELYEDLA
jgi:catechol 2,3-dioxygenase-like lactoylglutathione lyase family enzyme